MATEKVEEVQVEAKKGLATAHEQNGDIQKTAKLNGIAQNIDPNPIINQKPNGHLHHPIEINGGPKVEPEADKTRATLDHQVNEPYQTTAPSTSSLADANPLVDVKPEINAQPITDANPVAEPNQTGDPTAIAGNYPSLVDSSPTNGLKPTTGEVSQAYTAEDGIPDKVTETRAESKVH